MVVEWGQRLVAVALTIGVIIAAGSNLKCQLQCVAINRRIMKIFDGLVQAAWLRHALPSACQFLSLLCEVCVPVSSIMLE